MENVDRIQLNFDKKYVDVIQLCINGILIDKPFYDVFEVIHTAEGLSKCKPVQVTETDIASVFLTIIDIICPEFQNGIIERMSSLISKEVTEFVEEIKND